MGLISCGKGNASSSETSSNESESSSTSSTSESESSTSESSSEMKDLSWDEDASLDDLIALRQAVLENHNYTASIVSKLADEEGDFVNFNLFNINDKALFEDYDTYFFNGYVQIKDKGIMDFQMVKSGSAVITDTFYLTNPALGVSSMYPAAMEHVFDSATFEKTGNNEFSSDDYHAMAIMATLGISIGAEISSAPASFKAQVSNDRSAYRLLATFVVNYQDPNIPGSTDDSFRQVDLDVAITVYNIGLTHNQAIESFLDNPGVYEAPTSWSEDDIASLSPYFNKTTPPFVEGLSYAYNCKTTSVSEGHKTAYLVDGASGDLRQSYGQTLLDNSFAKINDNEYLKTVDDEERGLLCKYKVVMRFDDPEARDSDGNLYGEYFPNGRFAAKFFYYEEIKSPVTDIASLNAYFAKTGVKDFLRPILGPDSASVTGFKNGTDAANQNAEFDQYAFVAPSTSGYFSVYFPTIASAEAAIADFLAWYEGLGFSKTLLLNSDYQLADDDFLSSLYSRMSITAETALKVGTNGKVAVRIRYAITNATIERLNEEENPSYAINLPAVEGARVVDVTPPSLSAKEGDGVVFKVQVDEGYTLTGVSVTCGEDDIEVDGPHPMTGAYSFVMPKGNVEIHLSVNETVPSHTISYAAKLIVDGVEQDIVLNLNDVIAASSVMPTSAKEGDTVNVSFVAKKGYQIEGCDHDGIGGTLSTLSFMMGQNDVLVTVYVSQVEDSGEEDLGDTSLLNGTYTATHPTNTSAVFYFIFDGEGRGSYSLNNKDSSRVNFTYAVAEDKSVTITLDEDSTTTKINAPNSGYRIVQTTGEWVNDSGSILENGSFSIHLWKISAGVWTQNEEATIFNKQ